MILYDVWVWFCWFVWIIRKMEDGNKEVGVGYIVIWCVCVSDVYVYCYDRNRLFYMLYKFVIIEILLCRRILFFYSFNYIYS